MRPVIPLAVENDEGYVELRADGTVRRAARVILEADDIGRMQAGYVCAKCWEPHPTPFPKECRICGFHMSDRQSEFLAKAYKGSERVGPSTTLADELALLEETEERMKREEWGVSSPQIIVPRGFS
jgi:hypothetical protein